MTLQFVMTSDPTSHDGVSALTNFLPEGVFEVEKIVGKRTVENGAVLYQVEWKGYPELVL